MALAVFRQIRQALTNLNPGEVREQADRPVYVILHGNALDMGWRVG